MKNCDLKINLGCGPSGLIDGFVNIDNSKAVLLSKFPVLKTVLYKLKLISEEKYRAEWSSVIYMDISRKFPFPDCSVKKIYTSHFLEHIPKEKGLFVVQNCYRVLQKGGVIRLVLPDLLWYAERYVQDTKQILLKKNGELKTGVHDEFLNTICGAYINKSRYGLEHCYMYDLPAIVCLLKEAGFDKIEPFKFGEGRDEELYQYDSRPSDSIHIECIK